VVVLTPVRSKAIFFDRDATLIDGDFSKRAPDKVQLLPGVFRAVRMLYMSGFDLYLFTNQAGITRGETTRSAVDATNAKIEELLGVTFDGICVAEEPEYIPGGYRKPSGRYISEVTAGKYDLGKCWMVGDNVTDAMAGDEADVKTAGIVWPDTDAATRLAWEKYVAAHPETLVFTGVLEFAKVAVVRST